MKLISGNPFRIIGLLADCSEKDIQKQKSRVNALISVGKEITSDYDFISIGQLSRNKENIESAFSKIEQSINKLNYALLWFVSGNHLDELAFKYLKDGNIDKAREIWQKPTQSLEVTDKNISEFNNLATLNLFSAFSSGEIDIDLLTDAINLKTILIESEPFSQLAHKIGGATLNINKVELINHFADSLMVELEPFFKNGFPLSEFIEGISNCNQVIVKYLSSKLTDKPLHEIELSIDRTKKKRNENPENGFKIGANLFTESKENIAVLKTLLSSSNMQYQVIADKLAKEILQCGIDYFQEYKESNAINPGEDAMKLFKISKSIAIGNQTKDRIKENIEGLDEWIKDKPERDKQNRIADDLQFITSKLENFQKLNDSASNAKELIISTKAKLSNIKSTLGAYDEFYLTVSSAVVNNAQGMLVAAVNKAQDGLTHAYDNSSKLVVLSRLKNILTEAIEATNLMGTLDMTSEVRTRYNTNKDSLVSLKNQIDHALTPRGGGSSGGGNCYIATMAYGSYDHPQVIALRRYRDNTLSKTFLGKKFIKIYYKYSPSLVGLLKNKKIVNVIIRSILNKLIKII